ncbi:hypothetical protein [Arthrobacter sp. KBS0703]|uniref:hypothetical protein n=1 Tax=Arthrobacter sp. KBS0703 TaxID=1955698 RepID=UPI0037BFFF19
MLEPLRIQIGYRGEIQVCLLNTDRNKAMDFKRGNRIAQLVIQRIEIASFARVDELTESVRGTGGFGSTGGFAAP